MRKTLVFGTPESGEPRLPNVGLGSGPDQPHRHPESPHLGGTADEIRAKTEVTARRSVAGGRPDVSRAWSGSPLLARFGHLWFSSHTAILHLALPAKGAVHRIKSRPLRRDREGPSVEVSADYNRLAGDRIPANRWGFVRPPAGVGLAVCRKSQCTRWCSKRPVSGWHGGTCRSRPPGLAKFWSRSPLAVCAGRIFMSSMGI